VEEILEQLATKSGLLGISGFNDLRDIESAAARSEEKATLALNVFVTSVRHYLGAYLVMLGGADAIVFTGGIGENSVRMRAAICDNLHFVGIELDCDKNTHASGEMPIHTASSRVQLWTIPTNEEIIVARQAFHLIQGKM
jgi:acetate kinase